MSPARSKELLENITNRVAKLYNNEDIYDKDFYNGLIKDITRLYHKDMKQIKIDLDMYESGSYYQGDITRIPAGSWVYVHQDEGGIVLCNDTNEYYYIIDYTIMPEEMFYD